MCIRSGQRGVASVEAVLVLPFLLVLAVLAVYTTQLMLLKKESQTEARLTAWRHATFSATCFSAPRTLNHGDLDSRHCSTSQASALQFLDTVERSGGYRKHKQEVVGTIRDAGIPGVVTAMTGASRTFGRPEAPAEHWTRVSVVDQHSVDAMRHWERRDLPIGYDVYLKKILDSETIFPNYFPKVQ